MTPHWLPARRLLLLALALCLQTALSGTALAETSPQAAGKTAQIHAETPAPRRFVVRGSSIIDQTTGEARLLRGIGYSPYMPGETPLYGASPGDDERYQDHFARLRELGVDYLHVFPLKMPAGFFADLDQTELVYGQDIWVHPYEPDFLDEGFLARTLEQIKAVIDHTHAVGRPDRLVLFSIGDELSAQSVTATDTRHPQVSDYQGKHLTVTGRTATEVALARLIDAAIDYELDRYGQRHLYCHTSWTHIGPVADRPDLEVPQPSTLMPDMGDLICLNIYSYARGVTTSPPGSVTGTPYQGYLEALATMTTKPILITQVGLSTSPITPKPWVPGWGAHQVEDVPAALRAVWRDMRTAEGKEKLAGMVFFELHDEWWKSGETPDDSERHDANDPEEWFGLYEIGEDHRLVPKGTIPATVESLFAKP